MARAYSRKDFDYEIRNFVRGARRQGEQASVELLKTRYLNNFHGHLPEGFYRSSWLFGPDMPVTMRRQQDKLHKAIDGAIAKLEVSKQLEEYRKVEGTPKGKHLEAMIAVYIEMRKRGYKHTTLAS